MSGSQYSGSAGGLLRGRHIVIVLGSFHMGGAERQALSLARWLKEEEGAKITFVGPDQGVVQEHCSRFGFDAGVMPMDWPWDWGKRLRVLALAGHGLRRLRPDAILSYTTPANIVCGLLWRFTGARCCVWSQRRADMQGYGRYAVRLAARMASAWVSNSDIGGEAMRTAVGNIKPVHVIPNGVELAPPLLDRAAWRAQLQLDLGEVLCCMVANLREEKDHESLLRAWRLVVDRWGNKRPKTVLALAGEDQGTGRKIEALIRTLGLEAYVRLLGYVADTAGLMNAADVGVHASQKEGCSNAVLEMMATGLPVVATELPFLRTMVRLADHEHNLTPQKDPTALALALLRLMEDEELRKQTGQANRAFVLEHFSRERMGRQTADLLKALLA